MSNYHKKRRRKLMHKRKLIKNRNMVLFLLLLIFLNAISFCMFFLLGINPIISLIWFIMLSIVCFFAKDIIKEIIIKYFFGSKNNDTAPNNGETNIIIKKQKNTPLRIAISVLCGILIIVSTMGDFVSAATSYYVIKAIWQVSEPPEPPNPHETTQTETLGGEVEEPTNHLGQKDYNLDSIMEWGDFFFTKEDSSLQLCANLDLALRKINRIKPISDDVLNESKDYGGNAKLAVDYTKQFNDYYDAKSEKYVSDPVVAKKFNEALNARQRMESIYITSENRKEISTLYFKAGIYGFYGNQKDNLTQALRYAWGAFVARISWGEYEQTDIIRLESIYSFLRDTDSKNTKQLNIVIDALDLLEKQLKEQPLKAHN